MEDDNTPAVDEHLLMFETERYRPLTYLEAKSGLGGAMIGFIGGISIQLESIDRKDVPTPGVSVNYSLPVPFATPSFYLRRPTGESENKPPATHHAVDNATRAQPAAQPSGSPVRHPAIESQIAQVSALTTLAALVAVTLVAGVRFVRYKGRVNFKSDVSVQDLEEWYASSSVDP